MSTIKRLVSHKVELRPTDEQVHHFVCCCGVRRFVYNWGLSRWKEYMARKESTSWMSLRKELNSIKKQQFPWMLDVNKCVPAGALADLGMGISNYFEDQKKPKKERKGVRFPKPKKKGKCRNSFYLENDKAFVKEDVFLHVPKLGSVKMKEALRFNGRVKGITISERGGKWFASFQIEEDQEIAKHRRPGSSVGLDLGIRNTIVTSTNRIYRAPMTLIKSERRLKRLSRQLSRKELGSNQRKKAKAKLSRYYYRTSCIREDFIHKVSRVLSRKYETVIVEDLDIKHLMSQKRIAKHIADIGLSRFVTMIDYKTKEQGGVMQKVDRYFPSSQLCFQCGYRLHTLNLSMRTYVCPRCHSKKDRDLQAAQNIHREGLRIIHEKKKGTGSSLGTSNQACGLSTSTIKRRSRFSGSKSNSTLEGGSRKGVCPEKSYVIHGVT